MATLDLGNVMGPQGPQGEQGEVGPQGPQGPQGEQGPPVDTSTLIAKSEKGAANGVATLDSSGKLVQMPTATDVGAVTQTVYELTLSDEWEVSSESSSCFLIVTGKIATVIARIRPKEVKTFSSYTLFTLPEGIQVDKYVDAALVVGGADQTQNRAVQVTPPNTIALFDGEYKKTPYSLNVSFKIV